MKIQIRVARGIGITINGQKPEEDWGVGESKKGFDCYDNTGNKRKEVTIGDHKIRGIYFDCSLEDFKKGKNPTTLHLTTNKDPILAKVTQVIEDPEDETATLIKAQSEPEGPWNMTEQT